MTLADITSEAPKLPNKIVIYGEPGIGKTELGASFPRPVFLMTRGEKGLVTLQNSGRIKPTQHFPQEAILWTDVLEAVEALQGEHEHRTFVLDTANGAERLCHEHVCSRDYNGDWGERGFVSYQRGYETAVNDWRNLLNQLDKLQARGMTVLLLAHCGVRPMRNPLGPDYDAFLPALHKSTWNVTVGWADMVLFAKQDITVEAEKGKRAKAKSSSRILLTVGTAAYEAKNRHGLPEEVGMGESGLEAFQNLCAAMKLGAQEKGGA